MAFSFVSLPFPVDLVGSRGSRESGNPSNLFDPTYPTHPTYATHMTLCDPQYIPHCEPAVLALNPFCRGQRAAGERGAVAGGVGERDRFRRTVEPDRMRAGNEP